MFSGEGAGYSASSSATSGDITTGPNQFGGVFGAINNASNIPWYVWLVVAVLVAALIFTVVF
jgi:hypothetical protein